MDKSIIYMEKTTEEYPISWGYNFIIESPNEKDIEVMTKLDCLSLKGDLESMPYPNSIKRFFAYISTDADRELSLKASTIIRNKDNKEIVAFCLIIAEKEYSAHLYNINVAQTYRRQGIAMKMIKKGISAIANKYKKISLEVERNNKACLLYKKLGFVIISK